MTIAYETEENDVADWSVYRIFSDPLQQRRLRGRRVAVAFLSAIAVCFFLIALLPDSGMFVAPLLSSFAAVLAYIARERTEKAEVRSKMKRYLHQGGMKIALGPREVSALPNGLHIASAEYESLLKWTAIKQINRTEAHLFIHWSENELFAIPRRAFADEVHETLFFDEIERYRGVPRRQGLSASVAPVSLTAGAGDYRRVGLDTEGENVFLKRTD